MDGSCGETRGDVQHVEKGGRRHSYVSSVIYLKKSKKRVQCTCWKAEQRNSCLLLTSSSAGILVPRAAVSALASPHRARRVQFTRPRVVASVHSRCSHTFAIISAPASPMATLVALVLAPMISGIAEASQTRRAVAPRTWEGKER